MLKLWEKLLTHHNSHLFLKITFDESLKPNKIKMIIFESKRIKITQKFRINTIF